MKKLYTFICALGLFLAFAPAQAQVLILEDFNDLTAVDLINYPHWSSLNSPPAFEPITTAACEGGKSVSINMSSGDTQVGIQYVFPTTPTSGPQLSTGQPVEVSFQFKVLDEVTDQLATADFGQLLLFYSIDAGATWMTYGSIGVADNTADCSTNITTPPLTVPANSNFAWKLEGTFSATYPDQLNGVRVYIDDFKAIEQVPCIQPVRAGITPGSITFNGAEIFWDDINPPPGPGQWEIAYCTSPGSPSSGNPFCNTPYEVDTDGSPFTLSGLNDGTTYYVYIRSDCGGGTFSAWTGPVQFQTTAIGSTCNPPIEVGQPLPYTDISSTDIYGADAALAGAPGSNCGGSTDLLDGFEVVYRYISPINDILSIDLTGLTSNNVGVFVYESCADIGNACIDGAVTTNGTDLNINSLFVNPGQDIYIVIASYDLVQGQPINTDYTLNIQGFQCTAFGPPDNNNDAAPNILFVTGQTLDFYTYNYFSGISPTIFGSTIVWYSDAAGTTQVDPSTITLNDGDVYYVQQIINGCPGVILAVTFNEFNCQTDLAGITSTTPGFVCDSGTVTLGAVGGSSGTVGASEIYWWENPTGGDPITTGPLFTTPSLTQTTSYWVSEVFIAEGLLRHQANPGPTANDDSSIDAGVDFSTTEDFVLVDLTVYVTGGDSVLGLVLENSTGIIQQQVIPVNVGTASSPVANVITLNYDIVANETYTLRKDSSIPGAGDPEMLYENNPSFPYPLSTTGSVSSSDGGTSNYYYFFDWTITAPIMLCEQTPRQEVIATVHPIIPTTVSADDLLVCVGASTMLHVQSNNPNYAYTWTDPTGAQVGTGADIPVTLTQNTTFTVTAVDTVTTCSFTNQITINVYGIATLPVDPATVEMCLGEVVELTAGGEKYDFENGTAGWTFVNNSNAPNGDKTSSDWHIVNSPFNPIGGTLQIISNDASHFFVSTGQTLGPSGTLNTSLISPPLNLVGVSNASISFYHYYRDRSNTNEFTEAIVEVSDDNGLTWNPLDSYGLGAGFGEPINEGTPDNFDFETYDISAYAGVANVRVRFTFTGGWGWYWAIDNFNLERTYINGAISWSPGTNLYFDEQLTIPYDGSPTDVVYFDGSTAGGTTVYTATLNVTNCGSVTENVTVTVYDTPIPTATSPQTFDQGETLSDLMVNGSNLTWYVMDANGNYTAVSVNTALVDGTTYYVSQTLNGCESGFLPITVDFTCPAPSNLQLDTIGPSPNNDPTEEAVFTWVAPAGAAALQFHYIVKVFENPGNNETLFFEDMIAAGQPFAIIEDLPCETDFRFDLYTVCEGGPNPINSSILSVNFSTQSCLGVNEFKFDGLAYYPNPTQGMVFFENKFPIESIKVYNLRGQQVFKKEISGTSASIDFSTLASGTYLVEVRVEGATRIVRIVKE